MFFLFSFICHIPFVFLLFYCFLDFTWPTSTVNVTKHTKLGLSKPSPSLTIGWRLCNWLWLVKFGKPTQGMHFGTNCCQTTLSISKSSYVKITWIFGIVPYLGMWCQVDHIELINPTIFFPIYLSHSFYLFLVFLLSHDLQASLMAQGISNYLFQSYGWLGLGSQLKGCILE